MEVGGLEGVVGYLVDHWVEERLEEGVREDTMVGAWLVGEEEYQEDLYILGDEVVYMGVGVKEECSVVAPLVGLSGVVEKEPRL